MTDRPTKADFDTECRTARIRKSLVEGNPGGYANECSCLSNLTRKAQR